jgi:hypothetical protein
LGVRLGVSFWRRPYRPSTTVRERPAMSLNRFPPPPPILPARPALTLNSDEARQLLGYGMNEVWLAKLRVVERAAQLLGREELSRLLNVPPELVDDWLKGEATMRDNQLLNLSRALDRLSRHKDD